MNRYVPHQNSFDIARKFEIAQSVVLIISTTLTLASIIINKAEDINFDKLPILNWVDSLCSFFAVSYMVLDIIINDKFYKGGKEKRLDLVDHGFDTDFSGEKSTGYFNAQGVDKGVYKLAMLVFENSLFTSEVAKKMTFTKWVYTGIIFGIFLLSAGSGNKTLVNNILQISATGILIQQAYRLQQFSNRIGNIHEDFKVLFNSIKDITDKSAKEGEMIRNILNYEATHAWGSILTDSKLFNKLNPSLSQKWETMKGIYKIK